MCNSEGKDEFYRQTRARFKHFCKKKLFSCAVLTRENCKTARERGKMLSKVSLHMYCPYSCASSTKWGKSTVCLGESR